MSSTAPPDGQPDRADDTVFEDYPVGGKPFHGWSCDCPECQWYLDRGLPRPGEEG